MYRTLTFKDKLMEESYEKYSHPIEYSLFRRLLMAMLLGSVSGSIYNLILGDYMYVVLGSFMAVQTILALYLSRKGMKWLNFISFMYQLEIQTLLVVLIAKLNHNLTQSQIMGITSAAFQVSVCLSIGTKCFLKIFIILLSSALQVGLGELGLLWSGFQLFSVVFALQVAYLQEQHKRQKFILDRNAELIKTNLINQIDVPIFRCRYYENLLSLRYLGGNQCSLAALKIKDQQTFLEFTRAARKVDSKTTVCSELKQTGGHNTLLKPPGKTPTLEQMIQKFSAKKLASDSENQLHNEFYTHYAQQCHIKFQNQLFRCQFILLNEEDPYCLIILQSSFDDQLQKFKSRALFLNDLLEQMINQQFPQIIKTMDEIELIKFQKERVTQPDHEKFLEKINYYSLKQFILKANLKLLFNVNQLQEQSQSFSMNRYLLKIMNYYRPFAPGLDIKVQFGRPTIFLCSQKEQVFMVLLNIVDNCFKFAQSYIEIELDSYRDNLIRREIVTISARNDVDQQRQVSERFFCCGLRLVKKLAKKVGFRDPEIINAKDFYQIKLSFLHD